MEAPIKHRQLLSNQPIETARKVRRIIEIEIPAIQVVFGVLSGEAAARADEVQLRPMHWLRPAQARNHCRPRWASGSQRDRTQASAWRERNPGRLGHAAVDAAKRAGATPTTVNRIDR